MDRGSLENWVFGLDGLHRDPGPVNAGGADRPRPPAHSDQRRRSLSYLWASRVLRSGAAGFVNVAFPYLILTHLGASVTILGVLYTAGALATAGLAIGLGRLGSRRNLRAAYFVALVLLPVGCLLLWFAPDLWVAALASVLGGFSATGSLAGGGVGGAAQPMQTAILSDLAFPEERTTVLSRFSFWSGLAAALGALVVVVVPFSDLFLLGFLVSLASALIAIPVEIRRVPRSRTMGAPTRKVALKFSATGILNGVSQGLVTPFLIPFFVLVYGVSASTMATYSAASGLVGTAALLLSPALERRWGFVPSLAYSRGTGAALAIVLPFLRLLPISVGIYLLLPALRVAAVPTQTSAMMGMVGPNDRSETAGANQSARIGAGSGATAFSGWSLDNLPLAVPFVGYAAAVWANIYLYVRLFGWNRASTQSPPDRQSRLADEEVALPDPPAELAFEPGGGK